MPWGGSFPTASGGRLTSWGKTEDHSDSHSSFIPDWGPSQRLKETDTCPHTLFPTPMSEPHSPIITFPQRQPSEEF